nr:hypothetical protein BaRGS_015064 [Batillaria attramentaria]
MYSSVVLCVGYALDTLFLINCFGWLNPGEEDANGQGLLYRFWVNPPGEQVNHGQLLYYGTDPFTPMSQLPLGLDTDGFRAYNTNNNYYDIDNNDNSVDDNNNTDFYFNHN